MFILQFIIILFIIIVTVCVLQVISVIVLMIQRTIISNIEVSAVVFSNLIRISYGFNHSIFLMHSQSYFINIIYCFVDSNEYSPEQQGKCIYLFWLNIIYVRFDPFHSFDAFTFMLHQSHTLFCLFNKNIVREQKLKCIRFFMNYYFMIWLIPYFYPFTYILHHFH